MYLPRKNLKTIPTLYKRCIVCKRFLFKRNLGKNEKYHTIGNNLFVCHQCFVKIERERLNEKVNRETKTVVESKVGDI